MDTSINEVSQIMDSFHDACVIDSACIVTPLIIFLSLRNKGFRLMADYRSIKAIRRPKIFRQTRKMRC